MNFEHAALIAAVVTVVFVSASLHARWTSSPSYAYQRVFTAAAAGLLFLVAGVIGWDLSQSHGWFRGTKWVDGPIWWQVGLGSCLVTLAGFWARRVPSHPPRR